MSDGKTYDYDLVVIGGGSGGLAACEQAADLGKRVALIDFVAPTRLGIGGEPSKLMHRAALISSDMKDAQSFGWDTPRPVKHDWSTMVSNIQSHIKSVGLGHRALLEDKGIAYLNARAEFIGANAIRTTDTDKRVQQVTSESFILAVGSRPRYPDIPGAEQFGITCDDLFWLPQSPGRTLVVGASHAALECAGALNGLGVDCSLMLPSRCLPGLDEQMATMVAEHLASLGVTMIGGCVPVKVEQVSPAPAPVLLRVTARGDEQEDVVCECNTVLFAIGRDACTENMGLDKVGVQLNPENGRIICDEREECSKSNVYAIGDCVDRDPQLAPAAVHASQLLVRRLFRMSEVLTDYSCVPTAVFTPLEYGWVGLSEEEAVRRYGGDVEVYHGHFQPLEFALPDRNSNVCYAKLICNKGDGDRVVGLHVFGPNAGEITQGFAIGLKLGARKSDFNHLVGIHPTCAEVLTTLDTTKASGESIMKTLC